MDVFSFALHCSGPLIWSTPEFYICACLCVGVRSLWATPIVMEEATLPRYTYTQTHSCLMKPNKRIWQYMLHWFDGLFVVRFDGHRYFGGSWVGLLDVRCAFRG